MHSLLFQRLYSAFFQGIVCYMTWYGPTSERVWMQTMQKNWLKYTDFTELKKTTSRLYLNCSIILLFCSSPSNFVAIRSVWLKKEFTVNCTNVLVLLILLLTL